MHIYASHCKNPKLQNPYQVTGLLVEQEDLPGKTTWNSVIHNVKIYLISNCIIRIKGTTKSCLKNTLPYVREIIQCLKSKDLRDQKKKNPIVVYEE